MQDSKEKILSPSRIDTLNTCSWNYWCKYHLKLPDEGNPGSKKGSLIHALFECLIKNKDRHYWKYERILKSRDCYSIPCISRFIEWQAKKLDLALDDYFVNKSGSAMITHRDHINEMIITGLNVDFYGKKTDVITVEKEHKLDVNRPEEGIRYIVRGFIDKIFGRPNDSGEIVEAEIVDYKTSKSKFDKRKVDFNMQGAIYQLFCLDLFPHIKKLFMSFCFLQFPKSPWQSVPPLPENLIKGVEVYLTAVFQKINNFTERDATCNYAKNNGSQNLCGSIGFKELYDRKTKAKIKTHEKKWICPFKEPYEYYSLVRGGEVIKSSKSHEELVSNQKEGDKIESKQYCGCPAYYPQQKSLDNYCAIR